MTLMRGLVYEESKVENREQILEEHHIRVDKKMI